MKKIKLSYKHILLLPVILVGILLARPLIPMVYNPKRRPSPMIRNHILRHTPIGTHIDDVITIIERNERWGTPSINRSSGFFHPRPWDYGARFFELIIGHKHIQARPEMYRILLLPARVTRIFWGFDEDGKLIEVYVDSFFIS